MFATISSEGLVSKGSKGERVNIGLIISYKIELIYIGIYINLIKMKAFRGILNNNGYKQSFLIYLDPNAVESYVTDFFSNDAKLDATINGDTCIIDNTKYYLQIQSVPSEILVIGKEEPNWFHYFCFCLDRPKFFLATDKEEV